MTTTTAVPSGKVNFCEAQTQTSLTWDDATGEVKEYVAGVPEVTHLEVPFSKFEDALFVGESKEEFDAAAQTLLASPHISAQLQEFDQIVEDAKKPRWQRRTETDPQPNLHYVRPILDAIVAWSLPSYTKPYKIHLANPEDFVPLPRKVPNICAVFSSVAEYYNSEDTSSSSSHQAGWNEVAFMYGDAANFEKEVASYPEERPFDKNLAQGDSQTSPLFRPSSLKNEF